MQKNRLTFIGKPLWGLVWWDFCSFNKDFLWSTTALKHVKKKKTTLIKFLSTKIKDQGIKSAGLLGQIFCLQPLHHTSCSVAQHSKLWDVCYVGRATFGVPDKITVQTACHSPSPWWHWLLLLHVGPKRGAASFWACRMTGDTGRQRPRQTIYSHCLGD